MFSKRYICLLGLALLSLCKGSTAYWIDHESRLTNLVKVQEAIDAALVLSEEASMDLSRLIQDTPDKNDKVEKLAEWLFGANENNKWDKSLCKSDTCDLGVK